LHALQSRVRVRHAAVVALCLKGGIQADNIRDRLRVGCSIADEEVWSRDCALGGLELCKAVSAESGRATRTGGTHGGYGQRKRSLDGETTAEARS